MKYILSILILLMPALSFAQKAEIDKAIKNNVTDPRGYFIAYMDDLTVPQLLKWFKRNPEFKLQTYTTMQVKEYGYTRTKISSVYFSSVKHDTFRNARTLVQRMAARRKYSDYRITDLSSAAVANLFWGGELTTLANRQHFLETFPEYKTDNVVKFAGLESRHLTEKDLQDFRRLYNDAAAVNAYKLWQSQLLDYKIKFKQEDPSYRITDLDDTQVAQKFWHEDLHTTAQRKEFLARFPEYVNNGTLKRFGLERKNLSAGELITFAELFGDDQSVIALVKKSISPSADVDAQWFTELYSYFSKRNDMTDCFEAMLDYDKEEDEIIVGKYITYTCGDYFSKPSLTDYYESTRTFNLLMQEIKKTPAVSKRPRLGKELIGDFAVYQFEKRGHTSAVRNELLSNFPERRDKDRVEYIYVNWNNRK